MKFNAYRESLMSGENENANTRAHDVGYDQGQKDLFVPIAGIGIICGVLGWILALAM